MKITHRYNGAVVFSDGSPDMRLTVIAAVRSGADLSNVNLRNVSLCNVNLRNANLSCADLRNVNLRNANLSDANLSNTDLSAANLSDANLRAANLRAANLRDANLSDVDLRNANLRNVSLCNVNLRNANLSDVDLRNANLSYADLRNVNLRNANLSAANLRDANLSDVDLRNANLGEIRADIHRALSSAPAEARGVLDALRLGRINGAVYEGECACLVGTIANIRGCHFAALGKLRPEESRPAERWFFAIKPGMLPVGFQLIHITVEWIEEWLADRSANPPRHQARKQTSNTEQTGGPSGSEPGHASRA